MSCRAQGPRLARLLVAGAAALMTSMALPSGAQAVAPNCLVPSDRTVAVTNAPLRFGIYPGGPVGSVNPKAPPRPEDPGKRLAALRSLADANPFVVRLYSGWTGDPAADDVGGWLDGQIAEYTAAGFDVELVVRYKPAAEGLTAAPAAFAQYIRGIVRRYAGNPRFAFLQVTNEANLPGAPDAADGAFAGAAEAVVQGVIAAKDEVRRTRRDAPRIGFSWAYDERPVASTQFWARLGQLGGRRFADAVDWVGLDTYPGTWAPQLALSDQLATGAATAVRESVRALRDCYMPMARLGNDTAVHIAENGFPTGPGRSEELQSALLNAMVTTVNAIRTQYGVTDYRWFDLRDSSSADPSIESQYGITRDDYSPKPAFLTYRGLIDRFSRGESVDLQAKSCRRSPVRVKLPRTLSKRFKSLVVHVDNRVVRRLRRGRLPRTLSISMASGRSAVKLRFAAKDRRTRVARRVYRVC